jgi:hypothetical protein
MATATGTSYPTQAIFGCKTARLTLLNLPASRRATGSRDLISQRGGYPLPACLGSVNTRVLSGYYQAIMRGSIDRANVTESFNYPLQTWLGLLNGRSSIGGPIPGGDQETPQTEGQLWPRY